MKYFIAILLALGLATTTFIGTSEDTIQTSQIVSFQEPKLQWNRYTNSNFEILSIDDSKGQYLNENIIPIKSWLITRWGFHNVGFTTKCRLVVTSTDKDFREFFSKDSPQCKVTNNEIVIWLSAENPRWNTSVITKVMTEVVLQEIENKQNVKLGFWVHRGMPVLNGDLPSVRQNFGNLSILSQKNIRAYGTKDIVTMTSDLLSKQPPEIAAWYDGQSAALMLMLIKEYGGVSKFNTFITSPDPEIALKNIYGINSYADCDVLLNRFISNLSTDIIGQGKRVPPNSYFTWPIP
jgi:hypothetical protein